MLEDFPKKIHSIMTAAHVLAALHNRSLYGLPQWIENWYWDWARTLLQRQNLHIRTNATWECPPVPMDLATVGEGDLLDLRKKLTEAKLHLPRIPENWAEIVILAEGQLDQILRKLELDLHNNV